MVTPCCLLADVLTGLHGPPGHLFDISSFEGRSRILKHPTGSHGIHISLGLLFWFASGGLVGDRFSYAAVAQWSVIIWSLTSIATGFATTPEMVLGLRALLGITQCVFVPAALAAIASVHSETTRSKAFAIWGTGQLSGVVLGGWYGGFVAERLDWRWVFWLVGAFGVAYGFLVGPLYDDSCHQKERRSGQTLPRLPGRLDRVIH